MNEVIGYPVTETGDEVTFEQFQEEFLGGGMSAEQRDNLVAKLKAIQESERRADIVINSGLIQLG